MNEVLRAADAARREERERLLGPDALSVVSPLVKHLAPKGYSILHIAGNGKPEIDVRGAVHFTPPILAVILEENLTGRDRLKKVVELEFPQAVTENGINGNMFHPLITERNSKLYAAFNAYMKAVKADPSWFERALPHGGYEFPPMSESERTAWERWEADEIRIATEVPHHLRLKS